MSCRSSEAVVTSCVSVIPKSSIDSHGAQMLKVDGIERVVPAAETMRRVAEIAESLGVTRLADITGLDRVGIPVYSSVVPKSGDVLSVYNGKGVRPIDAQVGALMEAIERQTALKVRLPCIEGSFSDLRRTRNILDPNRVNQRLASDYSEQHVYSWIEGQDIVSGESCWVPARLAGYLWDDVAHPSCFEMNDTNGLASGNCREEAICHALCELAERDAWTMAELGSHKLPRQRRSLAYGVQAKDGLDDLELCPCLDLDSNELMQKFHRADLFPVVRDITSELGVPSIFASAADEHLPDFPMAHSGLGAHPNVNVALRRALTELAQSRCVDIQGVREDLLPANAVSTSFALHTRRISAINRNSWYLGQSKQKRRLAEISSRAFGSVDDDMEFLLDRFAACGLYQIIVIDFTPPTAHYSVVRVIVPGIESWATDHGRLGPRAVAFWKQHA
jgi:YcaO-like protein with predicted kinase domain